MLTGHKFLNIGSKPDFFNNGLTTASFHFSGKIPDSKELLIILVTTGIRGSMQDFTSGVGIGSRQQDVDLDFTMSMRTSSLLSGANASINGGVGKLLLVPLSW